jgi:hypothetical protein
MALFGRRKGRNKKEKREIVRAVPVTEDEQRGIEEWWMSLQPEERDSVISLMRPGFRRWLRLDRQTRIRRLCFGIGGGLVLAVLFLAFPEHLKLLALIPLAVSGGLLGFVTRRIERGLDWLDPVTVMTMKTVKTTLAPDPVPAKESGTPQDPEAVPDETGEHEDGGA